MAQTSTGVRLSISSGTPASYDLSGYGALTYFEIGEITNIPQFGAQFQTVTNNPLATGITGKHKGFVNYGDPTIDMALDGSNMGQQMMKSACDGLRKSQVHAFMLQYGNGEIRYWSGRVFSFQEAPGSANNMVGATSQIGITRAIIQIPRITLDLSFAENFYSLGGEPKNFSDIITFSRSTTSTYFDQNGVMQTAPIDTPCLAYDPSTLEPLGLQVFGAATNLLTYSEQFDNVAWNKADSSITADSAISPDGLASADRVTEGGASGSHEINRVGVVAGVGQNFSLSVYAKADSRQAIRLGMDSAFNGAFAVFNLSDGSVTDSVGSAKIKECKNGWFMCSLSVTAITDTPFSVYISVINDAGERVYQGDGNSGIYIWGAQLETGSIATPYIKTEASQVTRAADIATVDDLSGWYNQSQGSVFVDVVKQELEVGSSSLFTFNDESADNKLRLVFSTVGNSLTQVSVIGGVSDIKTTSLLFTSGNSKVATDFSAYAALNGESEQVSQARPLTISKLSIGTDFNGGTPLGGHIKTLNYYPSALTENEMKLITL